jgi:heptosyltransferase-2
MRPDLNEFVKILIIKLGALGDVVRTSYILPPLYARGAEISWVVADAAFPLLKYNPFVNQVLALSTVAELKRTGQWDGQSLDWVISLDDEANACALCSGLKYRKITGAYLRDDGCAAYTEDTNPWFDMGLISRLGKGQADELKKRNLRTHDHILSEILGLPPLRPQLFLDPKSATAACRVLASVPEPRIGLNFSSGGRWPSKKPQHKEAVKLVRALQRSGANTLLLGGSDDLAYLSSINSETGCPMLPECPLEVFAAVISQMAALITSDSLALHLAIAQRVPSVSYYAPTSAAEINTFGLGEKVTSLSPDYCSYGPNADNTSLTADRILQAFDTLRSRLDR